MEALYPDFYKESLRSDKSGDILEMEFLKEDWMTIELVEELYSFVPPSAETQTTETDIDSKLQSLFQQYCSHLFPVHREFANYRQLDQYVDLFLKSWKIRKNRDGNSFKCFYAQSHRVYTSKSYMPNNKRYRTKQLKDQIRCPFFIRWSCPGVKDKSLAPIFRKVYIIQCNPVHRCGLCKESFRIAMRMSKSKDKYDIKSLSNVLRMTKIDPCLPARHLRSLLQTCLPDTVHLDSDF